MELHPFETVLVTAWPPDAWQDLGVLIAVSGGADSVALLRGLDALKTAGRGRLAVAHFNHRLRAGSGQDAEFVAELASRLDLPTELGHGNTTETARLDGDGIEAAARNDRYRFLQSTAERIGARFVVTAHTADDQAETILHRIVRGTGVAGLAGMRRVRPLGDAVTLVRPLLAMGRAGVLAYLKHLGQPFRDDPSNTSLAFTRNRIRHGLLPLLKAEYNSEVMQALLRLGTAAEDTQRIVQRLVEQRIDDAVRFPSASQTHVNCDRLIQVDRHLIRELFVAIWRRQSWPQQSMGFSQWDRLADLVLSRAPRKQTFPGAVVAERSPDVLSLMRFE